MVIKLIIALYNNTLSFILRLKDILKRVLHFLPALQQTVLIWLLRVQFISVLIPKYLFLHYFLY